MEIYEHNAVYGNTPAPQKNKSITVWIALITAAVALAVAIAALIVACVRPPQQNSPTYADVFANVRGSVVEVYGAD